MKKLLINIVYSPQKGEPHIVYKDHRAEIWHSGKYDPNKINVGMGWYSIRKPTHQDSILVIEPFCVLQRDYNPNFVGDFYKIFTWAIKGFPQSTLKNKVIEVNHPSCRDILNKKKFGQDWIPWNKRKDEIVIIANNKSAQHYSELYSIREKLADLFHKHSKFQVSWYGQIPMSKPYYKGAIKSKHKILKNVKFSLCTENSYDKRYTHNYFTEKMPEVWNAGAVPLYIGCYNIDEFKFPSQSYIDLRKFFTLQKTNKQIIKFEQLLSLVENYDENRYNNYTNIILNRVLTPNSLLHHISYDRMYKKIINTFVKHPPPKFKKTLLNWKS